MRPNNALPIVRRELLVRARSRATYWSRLAVAAVGVLVCLPFLVMGGFAPGVSGKPLFDALVASALVLSGTAALLAADSISRERREGTLGLLLLTRVRVMDVVLGKLGAAGMTWLCALIAFAPVLVLPILAGGVAGGEALRKALVLCDSLFLSLAAGLFASAGQDRLAQTTRYAAALLVLIFLVPWWFLHYMPGSWKFLGLLSPIASLVAAGDPVYQRESAVFYWASLVVVSAEASLLLLAAARRLRRAPMVRPERMSVARTRLLSAAAALERQRRWRHSGGAFRPVQWLVWRQAGVQTAIWAAALLVLISQGGMFLFTFRLIGGFTRSWVYLTQVPSLAFSLVSGALLAWAASRFFVEARRNGELELLLTTPAGVRTLVSDQWSALLHLLRWPMVVMALPLCLRLMDFFSQLGAFGVGGPRYYPGLLLLALLNLCASVGAICWVALWLGFRTRTQLGAVAWTVGLVKALPYVGSLFCHGLIMNLANSYPAALNAYLVASLGSQTLALLLYWLLIRFARARLIAEISGRQSNASGLLALVIDDVPRVFKRIEKARHWTPG